MTAGAGRPGEGPGRLEIGAAGLEAARTEAGWEGSAAGGEVASADEALRGSLQAAVEGLAEEAEVQGRIALGEAPAEARREARAWREQARALLSGSNSRVHPVRVLAPPARSPRPISIHQAFS